MIPRATVGSGITGAVRYLLGEGKDYSTGKNRSAPKGDRSRVEWMGGINLGFEVESREDADLARRLMEFTALNQHSRTRKCEKDCYHLSLSWRPGEQPSRTDMEEAARQALAAIGMSNALALLVAHNDEKYAHLHIVASKINPDTGKAYDLKGDRIHLSKWAQGYEQAFSGGILCARREEANQTRDAIDRRDAAAVLEVMTRQRATFKGSDLERVLSKQIKSVFERAQFAEQVLAHADTVRLADAAGGPASRYTARAVLEAEGQVLHAAADLAGSRQHAASLADQVAVAALPAFRGMSEEQAEAVRHATDAAGLALIDGQAGTGKSFTLSAVRQIYERGGYRVIGLAPTNAVATDMRADGFSYAATIHSELFKLNNGRAAWNPRTLVVVDEAAMIDTKLMAQLAGRAQQAGAKLVLAGDDRQLSSIDRGGMFGVLKDRYGAAELTQVRRQHKNDDRRAAELMAEGNFSAALGMYDSKGAITWTRNQDDAREALVDRWTKDSAADPAKSRFVFAYTNEDVSQLNAALRTVRRERGELDGADHSFDTRHGRADFAGGDRIQLTGTDKARGLDNGAAGTIIGIEGHTIAVQLDGRGQGQRIEIDAAQFKDFRHGYAGTVYKGQGRTLDQTYLYHSEHWRSAASYVGLTRHRDKAELFVATNTAADVKALARQMARVDDRRAASHFHQTGTPVPVPPIELANVLPASTPDRWTDRGGMVPQQEAALRQVAKPRITIQAATRERPSGAVPPAPIARPTPPPAQPAPPAAPAATAAPAPLQPVKPPASSQPQSLSPDQMAKRFGEDRLKSMYDRANEPTTPTDPGQVRTGREGTNRTRAAFLRSNLVTRRGDKANDSDHDPDRDNPNTHDEGRKRSR